MWFYQASYFPHTQSSSSAMGLSSTTINYTAGDKTDNQWLNGAAASFVK